MRQEASVHTELGWHVPSELFRQQSGESRKAKTFRELEKLFQKTLEAGTPKALVWVPCR